MLAISIAYIREFGARTTGDMDFAGPFSKQQRMILVILTSLIGGACLFLAPVWALSIMQAGLWILILGLLMTLVNRSWRLMAKLP